VLNSVDAKSVNYITICNHYVIMPDGLTLI